MLSQTVVMALRCGTVWSRGRMAYDVDLLEESGEHLDNSVDNGSSVQGRGKAERDCQDGTGAQPGTPAIKVVLLNKFLLEISEICFRHIRDLFFVLEMQTKPSLVLIWKFPLGCLELGT